MSVTTQWTHAVKCFSEEAGREKPGGAVTLAFQSQRLRA